MWSASSQSGSRSGRRSAMRVPVGDGKSFRTFEDVVEEALPRSGMSAPMSRMAPRAIPRAASLGRYAMPSVTPANLFGQVEVDRRVAAHDPETVAVD